MTDWAPSTEQQICIFYMRALQETSTLKGGQKDTKIGLNCIATMDTHHYFSKDRFAFDALEQLRYVHNTTIYDYNSSRPLFPACYLQFLDSATSFQTIPILEDQRMGLCSNLAKELLQFHLSCYFESRVFLCCLPDKYGNIVIVNHSNIKRSIHVI